MTARRRFAAAAARQGEIAMQLGAREFWAVIHGLVLGTLFLLAFAGGFAGFYSLRPEWVTVAGVRERLRRLPAGS